MQELKTCTFCKKEKPAIEFKWHPRCTECKKKYRRDYYLKNRELEIHLSATWTKENEERSKEYKRNWWKKITPEQRKKYHVSSKMWRNRTHYGSYSEVFTLWLELEKTLRPTRRYEKRKEYFKKRYLKKENKNVL